MTNLKNRILVLFCFFVFTAGNLFSQDLSFNDLDSYIKKTLKEFEVPGMSVGIIKEGKVIFAKGFGVKNIKTNEPVDTNTLFQIASNSKAFTAACLAILVDEGKLNWDDRVVDHLPGFQMSDPYVTKEMRVRDLLCHRSGLGLGAGDLLFFPPTDFTREQVLYKLRFIKLKTSFRSAYAYDNILYPVAGELIKAVSGKTWEEFVKENIFDVLGMNSTRTGVTYLKKDDNVATPHSIVEGTLVPIELSNFDNIGPAGSILSNVNDLIKWVTMQLDSGRFKTADSDSNILFTKKETVQMWKPHTIIPVSEPPELLAASRTNFRSYGLGWDISEYYGNKIVWHTGGLPGMVSRITMVPGKKIGIIILTNQLSGAAFQAVTYHVLDLLLDTPTLDWIERFSKIMDNYNESVDKIISEMYSSRNKNTKPSLALEKYAGKYEDVWYGTITIKYEDEKLYLNFDHTPQLSGELEHWQYDTFVARWKYRDLNGDAFVTFSLKPDGSIDEIKMKAFRPDTDFSFDFQDLLFTPVKMKSKSKK